jgi:hypothetical protein
MERDCVLDLLQTKLTTSPLDQLSAAIRIPLQSTLSFGSVPFFADSKQMDRSGLHIDLTRNPLMCDRPDLLPY